MKALLVDDDIPTLEVIRDSIHWEAFGIYTVAMAYNISDAKNLIEDNTPAVIICDIEMPKGSGIELLKWVREKGHDCEFIFLTCHENFEFASTAINYNAVAYVTKPFNSNKTEAAIAKAVDAVAKRNHFQEYSEYGKYWVDSKPIMEKSFWRDILFHSITPKMNHIQAELVKRHLPQDMVHDYYIVLSCISKSQIDDSQWDDDTFKYAFCNLSSEIILDELDLTHIFSYIRNETFYNVIIVNNNLEMGVIISKCRKLIQVCDDYLQYKATCYVSEKTSIEHIARTREELEEQDRNNILSRGKVVFQKDRLERITKEQGEQYALDTGLFNKLLMEGEKVQIVNTLKKELETLAAEKRLDSSTLHSIRQDFMQIIYAALYKCEIQAHKLFSDDSSQKLFQSSENTVFDMMKWAAFITNRTVDYMKEVQKSESVVGKAKRFILQNYTRNISREDIALNVFLTPDYLSKIFKAETGIYIKDYINEIRIEKAKELLIHSNSSISDIACETGFENFSYFSTVFKKATGESPYTFRKTRKKFH